MHSIFNGISQAILKDRYLLSGETPEQGIKRACIAFSAGDSALAERMYSYVTQGWMMFSSPILSNGGTKKGLPISCYLSYVPDSKHGIQKHYLEVSEMSSLGGGIGSYYGDLRSDGCSTSSGNVSSGMIPFSKVEDFLMPAWKQGVTRGGASAIYLDISHPEIEEFISIRNPGGDPNRRYLNLHTAVNIPDSFMQAVKEDTAWSLIDPHTQQVTKSVNARNLWEELLKTRIKRGEPYIHFIDASNRALPQALKDKGLNIKQSNLCSEILLPTAEAYSAVCCLSSVNLEYFDQWKDTTIVEDCVTFLDNVIENFVERTGHNPNLRYANRSAFSERSIGLGAMGFHSYLQKNMIPFESALAASKNKYIFKTINEKATNQTKLLAEIRGEAPYLKGTGRRNAHLIAVAPNATSSLICGQASPGVEPVITNAYNHKTMSGTFFVHNKYLVDVAKGRGVNVDKMLVKCASNGGSVYTEECDFLDDYEKSVFATAFEIDQSWVVEHAAQRQPYICQGQSLNLFFQNIEKIPANYLNKVHFMAWQKGLKTLYYLKSTAAKDAEKVGRAQQFNESTCLACEG